MKDASNGNSKDSDKKKQTTKKIHTSKANRLAEKEYEEYYNRIKLLSKGL